MSVRKMFEEIMVDELSTALVGGMTKMGSYIFVTHKDLDIKTLRQMKKMIADRIVEMKEDAERER